MWIYNSVIFLYLDEQSISYIPFEIWFTVCKRETIFFSTINRQIILKKKNPVMQVSCRRNQSFRYNHLIQKKSFGRTFGVPFKNYPFLIFLVIVSLEIEWDICPFRNPLKMTSFPWNIQLWQGGFISPFFFSNFGHQHLWECRSY